MKLGANQSETLFSADLPLHAFSGTKEPEISTGNSSTKPLIASILLYLSTIHSYGKNNSPDYYGQLLKEFSLEKPIKDISNRSMKKLNSKNLHRFFKALSDVICQLKEGFQSKKYFRNLTFESTNDFDPFKDASKISPEKLTEQGKAQRMMILQKRAALSTPRLLLWGLDDCMKVVKELLIQTPVHSIPLRISPSYSALKKRVLYSFLHYTLQIRYEQETPPNFSSATSNKRKYLQEIYEEFSIKIDDMIKSLHESSIGQKQESSVQNSNSAWNPLHVKIIRALTHDVTHSYLPVLHRLAKGKGTLSEVLKNLEPLLDEINSKIAMYEIEKSDTELLEIELIKKFNLLFLLILLVQDSVECTDLPSSKLEDHLFLPSACIEIFTEITPFSREKPQKERSFRTPTTQTKRVKELSLNRKDSGKKLLAKLKKVGYFLKAVRGSHHQLQVGPRTVTIPIHGNEPLQPKTFNHIQKELRAFQESQVKDTKNS